MKIEIIGKDTNEFEVTNRPNLSSADEELNKVYRVLDKGFVRLVDYMGSDATIVRSARVSYGAGTKKVSEDAGLIDYLMRHRHTSPFEFVELAFHIKCPIFVARQWVRHRAASMNEYSGRYSEIKDEYYIPDAENVSAQSLFNKQGRDGKLDCQIVDHFRHTTSELSQDAFDKYQTYLSQDVTRELARIGLPLNTYTEFYWKMDLHNLMHFLKLRTDSHAQYEIRVFADAILEIAKSVAPLAMSSWENHIKNGKNVSGDEQELLKILLSSTTQDAKQWIEKKGWSKTKTRESINKIIDLTGNENYKELI